MWVRVQGFPCGSSKAGINCIVKVAELGRNWVTL